MFEYGGLTTSSRTRGLSRPVLPFSAAGLGEIHWAAVPILLAAKIAGRHGKTSMGFIDAVLEDHQGLGMQNTFAGRVARDVFEQSSIGMISTAGNPNASTDNMVFGPDFRYRTAGGQRTSFRSESSSPLVRAATVRRTPAGHAYGASLAYPNDFFPSSCPVCGNFGTFLPSSGVRSAQTNPGALSTYASINPRPERPEWLRQYRMAYSTEHYTDLQTRLETALHRITPLWLEFNSGDELYLSVDRQFDGPREPFTILDTIDIPRGEYWWNQYRLGAEFATRRKLSGDITASMGDFYTGNRWRLGSGINYYPWKRLSLGMDYDYNQITLGPQSSGAHIGAGRVVVNFTPNLTWGSFGSIRQPLRVRRLQQPADMGILAGFQTLRSGQSKLHG